MKRAPERTCFIVNERTLELLPEEARDTAEMGDHFCQGKIFDGESEEGGYMLGKLHKEGPKAKFFVKQQGGSERVQKMLEQHFQRKVIL